MTNANESNAALQVVGDPARSESMSARRIADFDAMALKAQLPPTLWSIADRLRDIAIGAIDGRSDAESLYDALGVLYGVTGDCICRDDPEGLLEARARAGHALADFEAKNDPAATSLRDHELKVDPDVFPDVWCFRKTFELRRDTRGYAMGETLLLRETLHNAGSMREGAPLVYTGREVSARVTHVRRGPVRGLADGWVILSIEYLWRRALEGAP